MNFRRPQRKADHEERILPLINVVFLLLIFFMLAGRLTTAAPFQVTPPASAEAEAPQPAADPSDQATVLLAADGRLALDGAEINAERLKAALGERLAKNAALPVRLKADGQTEATQVVALMEVLRDAGVERLQLFAQSIEGESAAGRPEGTEARP